MPATLPPLLTAAELSQQWNYPKNRIYELTRSGQLPVVRIGRAVRYCPDQIRSWVEAGGSPPE